MGSRSKIDYAYIAGFLDGDGSLMLQIKKRSDSKSKTRFMSTICFYQDTRHEEGLYWIKKSLGKGYLSQRNDGMTELRIQGFDSVGAILKNLKKFLRFKKIQADALCKACEILGRQKRHSLNREQLVKIVELILVIQHENYATRNKKTKESLFQILGLTP